MKYTLTVLDTAGIQPYIFGSNKLRENIGASELVYRAARQWAFAVLEKMFPSQHNILLAKQDEIDPYDSQFHIDNQKGRAAEVLYVGGGKTVILFAGDDQISDEDLAKDFVYELSKVILRDAPGLNLYAAHAACEWGQEPALPDLIEATAKKLGQLKGELPGSRPMLGLSVTAACTSTGLPANGSYQPEGNVLSNIYNEQVLKKREAAKVARSRLQQIFSNIKPELWTDELDEIAGNEEGENFIAVVHADGNGMGKRIQAWNNAKKGSTPRQQIQAMRDFSTAIARTATEALETTVLKFYNYLKDNKLLGAKFPFRPVVFGGDDVTVVCAGEWGLALAQAYLAELEKKQLPDGHPPYGCAGISIVKTHYPFARAYDMSELLAGSAKKAVLSVSKDKMASAMDWHFTTTGLLGDLEEIRKREYLVPQGWLQARPLFLKDQYGWRQWANFEKATTYFQRNWGDSRNKTVALRGALRQGRTAVQQFKTIYKHDLDTLDKTLAIETAENGWALDSDATYCVYFDAIEMMDNFSDLPSQQEGTK